MGMGIIVGLIVLLLLIAAGAYGYFMYYLPMSAAPQNTLTSTESPAPNDLTIIESELGAESDASFEAEMESLENSF